jgi:predicted ribosomally synthesized peptide with SipW-like signal peptide
VITLKKILLSLGTILLTLGVVTGATWAYFKDQAVLDDNTYATGILEIRLNGQESLPGFNVTNAYPGLVASKVFTLANYGAPHFAGPSTLDAKGLTATAGFEAGDSVLYDSLEARLYANAGWGGCSNGGVNFVAGKGCEVYDGLLKDLSAEDILNATQWGAHPSLVPGNSFTMTFEVELPENGTDQSTLMGKSTTFDLLVDGYTNWPL